jgi:hypothetical protein
VLDHAVSALAKLLTMTVPRVTVRVDSSRAETVPGECVDPYRKGAQKDCLLRCFLTYWTTCSNNGPC